MKQTNDANSKLTLLENFGNDRADQPYFANVCKNPLAEAFKKKRVVHAGLGGVPLKKEETISKWQSLVQMPRQGKTTAYIHIPFCETRCLYCGFYANPSRKDDRKAYTRALIREMEADHETLAVQSSPIHAVYLGGGTPTALEPEELKSILLAVKKYLPLANDCEITVEGRILNFGEDKIDACLEGGANRFSLGVQTFDSNIRKKLGRRESRDKILKRLEVLKKKDNAAVIIDLIFGLPGQTMETWEDDINTFFELDLDGIDLYQLIQFKGGLLEKAAENGKVSAMADMAQRSEMFARGVEIMTKARYRRLSISHWGRTFRERNLYNLFMKQKAHCLAYGSGAGGNLFGHMYFLDGNLKSYLASAGSHKPITMMMAPSKHETLIKKIAGELELGRIDLAKTGESLSLDLETIYAPLLAQWEKAGLIEYKEGWVTLTLAGEFWQTTLAQNMIDYFKEACTTNHEIL